MRIVGIDPGVTGGFALIAPNGERLVTTLTNLKAGKTTIVDVPAFCAVLNECAPDYVIIEKVAGRAKQGGSSMFTFGAAWGCLLGASQACGYPTMLVSPQRWKIDLGLIGLGKAGSLALARKLYPECAKELRRVKDHDRAEALLIAHWLSTIGAKRLTKTVH